MLKEAQSVRLIGSRIKIEYELRHRGTVTSQQHNSIASSCGVVIKQNCPMQWESWAKIPEGTKKLDISPEAMAYIEETLATRYKHWRTIFTCILSYGMIQSLLAYMVAQSSCRTDRRIGSGSANILRTQNLWYKKYIAGKIARDSRTLLHHSGSKPFSYRLEARRQGSKFPEIDMFEDIYVRPGDETTNQLHVKATSQLSPETPIEDVTVPEDVGFQILTNVMDQNFGRHHGKVVRCMGKARVRETSASISRSNTAKVSALKEEVTTLKGQLAIQSEQMRAQEEQIKA
ncbi:hypothetical protein D8674_036534 [Pyrus ussuriensis x Pyrus communis]|uniref:Uncharacterized protein n=1 Tax=Pyrus ussuriensis x Pyrus communis TaxID=2448454 RepID=A0A5N5G3A9_9ROSA|nr:hypothetical protein D8674_036534 [Pyrus ussuriensis x Pyrus communis]